MAISIDISKSYSFCEELASWEYCRFVKGPIDRPIIDQQLISFTVIPDHDINVAISIDISKSYSFCEELASWEIYRGLKGSISRPIIDQEIIDKNSMPDHNINVPVSVDISKC